MTHFHSDHASGLERFAHATVAADRVEWHAAEHDGGYHHPVVRAVKRREILDYEDAAAGMLGTSRCRRSTCSATGASR